MDPCAAVTALCCAGYFHEHVRCAAFDALPSVISATQSAFPAASGVPASMEHEGLNDHAACGPGSQQLPSPAHTVCGMDMDHVWHQVSTCRAGFGELKAALSRCVVHGSPSADPKCSMAVQARPASR